MKKAVKRLAMTLAAALMLAALPVTEGGALPGGRTGSVRPVSGSSAGRQTKACRHVCGGRIAGIGFRGHRGLSMTGE